MKTRHGSIRLFACALASAVLAPAPAAANDWQPGQVFVNRPGDFWLFRVFNGSGVFQEEFTTSAERVDMGTGAFGPAFAADGRLYTTASGVEVITDTSVHRLFIVGNQHPHPILATIDTEAYAEFLTSIVFDAAGDFYVSSEEGFTKPAGIHKHTPTGALIESFLVPVDPGIDGVRWMDLAADQKTMYYVSAGPRVRRHDLVADAALSDFATITGIGNFRLLPPFDGTGGLIYPELPAGVDIRRTDSAGVVIQTYDLPGLNRWRGTVSLDANGTSFWALHGENPKTFYRFNLATGVVEAGPFAAVVQPPQQLLSTIMTLGELRGGSTPPQFDAPAPCESSLMASAGVPMSFTVAASDFNAGDVVTLTASGLPAGATMTPSLPTNGNGVSSTFQWTPASDQVGVFEVSFTATDHVGHQTVCASTITVAECHLILGVGGGDTQRMIFGHLYATQLDWVRRTFPVTMTDMPSFPPLSASGSAVGGLQHFPISVQVVMYNPLVFPDNPEQWSQRMELMRTPTGRVDMRYFGTENGIQVRAETFVDKAGRTRVRFPFTIDGM